MNILALDSVTYGVDDMETACRFWEDFGLTRTAGDSGGAIFETREKATIVLRPADDPALPPAPVDGPTAREFTWGTQSQADVERIAAELATDREVRIDDEGTAHSVDPEGYAIAFRATRRIAVEPEPPEINTPGVAGRVGRRAKFYPKAAPLHLSHMVILVPDLEAERAFYVDRLGFKLTDSYKGRGHFLRCGASNEHHNLFLMHAGEDKGFHHVAFEVRDMHELFGGGTYLSSRGWQTHIGPGRHPISSAYFWYFRNPCGGAAEYDFDSDYVTDDWEVREWDMVPEAFAEWAAAEGIDRYAGVQTASV